jgi:hypothetical protein
MSVRDLLTFNFFLQFADGLVSYQAFALGAAEAQSRSGRCNGKLGHDWGANLQQNAGVCTAALDIRVQTQPTLPRKAGIDRDGLGVRVRNYRFPLATPTIYGGQIALR